MGINEYLSLFQNVIPQGLAWPRWEGSFVTKLLKALSPEFARIDARLVDLQNEADPRTTVELIDEWEKFAGLPDICVTEEQTLEQRRVALCAKLLMEGGQSVDYFIGMAEALGYANTTIDHQFFEMDCESDCDAELHGPGDKYVWVINLLSDGGYYQMDCESPCDEALASWGDEAIECRIRRYAPAHTTPLFAYLE